MIHTRKKLFQCVLICGKSVVWTTNMKSYKMIFKGEKLFHCVICGNQFEET